MPRFVSLPLLLAVLALAAPAAHAAEPGVTPLANVYDGKHQVDEHTVVTGALSKAPAGKKWTRLFVDWNQLERVPGTLDPYELGALQARVGRFKAAGLKVALVVSTAPGWAAAPQGPEGARQYADFMVRLARAVPDVDVWELWNEPNVAAHFSAEQYAGLLRATYPALKAAVPGAQVIVGGLGGNDYDYVIGIYGAGGQGFFDGIGLHTDTPCLTASPKTVEYRDFAGRIGFTAFTGYREVHQVMADHGDGAKGIYLTEIGWQEARGKRWSLKCAEGSKKGKKVAGVDATTQARFLKQAYACLAADPYVVMASWFTDQDPRNFRRVPAGNGLFDYTGKRRAAYAALQSVGDGSGAGVDRSCGGQVDRDPPTITVAAGPTWFGRLVVTGAAADAGSGVRRIELWGDGKKIVSQKGGVLKRQDNRFRYDWFGSSKLSFGKHVVELRAFDAVGNVGKAAVEVQRLDPASAPRVYVPSLSYVVARSGRRFTVRARVGTPADRSFREHPRGRLELRFERFSKGRWKRSRIRTGIASGRVKKTYTAYKGGRWRAYGVLDVEAPYKRVATKPVKFKLR